MVHKPKVPFAKSLKNGNPHGESNSGSRRERAITDISSVQFYNALIAKPGIKTVCKSCAKQVLDALNN